MMLRLGQFGDDVKELQTKLNKLGANLVVDGYFGFSTNFEVQKFQKKNNLVADGLVGPITFNKINYLLSQVDGPKETITGVDLYHGDQVGDWTKLKDAGVKFVFLKATEGIKYIDPLFKSRWQVAKLSGLIRGAYHFFRPAKSAIVQAQLFCDTVNDLNAEDLPLVLDWETSDDTSFKSDKENAMKFLTKVEDLSGKRPIIYTSPSFANELYLEVDFFRYPLWIAHYRAKNPRIPKPWTDWKFWQVGEDISVMGINNPCDFNLFNGSLEDLKKFISDSKV